MQNTPWIALLKKLPPELHHQLMLVTAGGTEIALQTILMLEGECLVIKGRMAGSQDAGRLIYVPYDRIDYVGFNRAVTENEFKAWYGDVSAPAPTANGAADAAAARQGASNRAALLERIRSRPTTHGERPS